MTIPFYFRSSQMMRQGVLEKVTWKNNQALNLCVFSSALWDNFQTQEVFGSFEQSSPGFSCHIHGGVAGLFYEVGTKQKAIRWQPDIKISELKLK